MGGRIAGGTARTQTMVLTWDVCVPIVLEPGHHNVGPFSFIVAMKACFWLPSKVACVIHGLQTFLSVPRSHSL